MLFTCIFNKLFFFFVDFTFTPLAGAELLARGSFAVARKNHYRSFPEFHHSPDQSHGRLGALCVTGYVIYSTTYLQHRPLHVFSGY